MNDDSKKDSIQHQSEVVVAGLSIFQDLAVYFISHFLNLISFLSAFDQ